MPPTVPVDRFLGCILGLAVGDGIGAPFEGLTSDLIFHSFGRVQDILNKPPVDLLCYTDDTQMMIGVIETLIAHGHIVESALCRAFASNYDSGRGYGSGARRIIEAMAENGDYRSLAENIFPGGSYGNGAAMRVAPVGIMYSDNLDEVARQARLSSLPTHTHPLGIEGAQLLAIAVALAAQSTVFDREAFYQQLRSYAHEEEYQWQLDLAATLTAKDSLGTFGNSLEAHRSVITAIACFTTNPTSYPLTIGRAISLGNDTDTIAAMAGAISGAHLGLAAIPHHLLALLEEQTKGRSYITNLAHQLHQTYLNRISLSSCGSLPPSQ